MHLTKLLSLKLFLEHCIIGQKSILDKMIRYVHFVRWNGIIDVQQLDNTLEKIKTNFF